MTDYGCRYHGAIQTGRNFEGLARIEAGNLAFGIGFEDMNMTFLTIQLIKSLFAVSTLHKLHGTVTLNITVKKSQVLHPSRWVHGKEHIGVEKGALRGRDCTFDCLDYP